MMNIQGQRQLQGKLFITANLKLITGMHIGANSDFCTYWGRWIVHLFVIV